MGGVPWSDEEVACLLGMARGGYSMAEVGQALGRTPCAVANKARGVRFRGRTGPRRSDPYAGMERRAVGEWGDEGLLDLAECEASGWGVLDTALELGVHPLDVAAKALALGMEMEDDWRQGPVLEGDRKEGK